MDSSARRQPAFMTTSGNSALRRERTAPCICREVRSHDRACILEEHSVPPCLDFMHRLLREKVQEAEGVGNWHARGGEHQGRKVPALVAQPPRVLRHLLRVRARRPAGLWPGTPVRCSALSSVGPTRRKVHARLLRRQAAGRGCVSARCPVAGELSLWRRAPPGAWFSSSSSS